MELGAIATFSFTVTSNSLDQTAAGLNVAASGGTLGLVGGQGTRLEVGEVLHNSPRVNDGNGEAVFEFTWQATEIAGAYTLFGAGTSANLNELRVGDAAERGQHMRSSSA